MKICAIISASGFSKRMGINKLLIPVGNKKMVEYTLDLVHDFPFERRIVVTTYEQIIEMAQARNIEVVLNDNPGAGQSRSVVLGVEAAGSCDGYMFFNGDMPGLKEDTIRCLVDNFARNRDKIIIPRYAQTTGSPTIFSSRFRDELIKITGDAGGRSVISKNEENLLFVPVRDKQQGIDIDTQEELHHYK